jgi:two-component sensor histidine kinase
MDAPERPETGMSMVIESASDRILRILVVSIGIGSVVFTLLGLAQILAQHPLLAPVYSTALYVVYLAVPPVLALLAFRVPVFALRVVLGAQALASLLLIAGWYRAIAPASVPTQETPWIFFTIAVASCTAALAFPYIAAVVFTLVVAAACGVLRFSVYGGGDASPAIQDAILITLFSIVLVTLLQLALRSARLQDEALAAAQEEASGSSASEAFLRQRLRYHQFTRDEVLETFGAVLRDGPTLRVETRQSAARALTKLDELQGESVTSTVLGAAAFEALLRASIDVAMPIGITTIERPESPVLIPVEVGDALAEALGEAVRNSIAHADRDGGTPVTRQSLVSIAAHHVQITVTDNGRGFVPQRIAPDRLGVRLSILQGVNGLPGGSATVESSRSGGTTVTLDWRKDAVQR